MAKLATVTLEDVRAAVYARLRDGQRQRHGTLERAARMAALYNSGLSLAQVGERFGVSRERVRQMLTWHTDTERRTHGRSPFSVAKRAAQLIRKEVQS